jgi:hypothetical protein
VEVPRSFLSTLKIEFFSLARARLETVLLEGRPHRGMECRQRLGMSIAGSARASSALHSRMISSPPALLDYSGICIVGLVRPATTRVRTASLAASGILMPATRTTARASTSMRSAEIASHSASHLDATL